MNKKPILVLAVASFMLLSGLVPFVKSQKIVDEFGPDNADYEENSVVDFNNPLFVNK